MDSSSRRSLSLNLNISDIFATLPYRPMLNLINNKNTFIDNSVKPPGKYTTPITHKMSHSVYMTERQSDAMAHEKNTNLLQSMLNMLGSFKNIVSKISNYMPNINNTLSVTVVPNGGIISSEYILKHLTRGKEHLSKNIETSANILKDAKDDEILCEKMRPLTMEFLGKQQMNSIPNEKLKNDCNILPKKWINSTHKPKINFVYNNSTCLMEAKKSMKKIKCMSKHVDKSGKSSNNKMSMSENNVSDNFIEKIQDRAIEEMPKIRNQLNEIELKATAPYESLQLDTPMDRPLLPKTCKKCNIVARSRGKGRGKLQLRKSGVSQLKHRKEKSKQNLYCDIQDDMSGWDDEEQDYSESLSDSCDTSTSPTIDNHFKYNTTVARYKTIDSDYPTLIQNVSLFHQSKCIRRMPKKISDCPLQSSFHQETRGCNFRSRLQSESSIGSEDSCFIVFENESESECTDYNCILPNTDESESDDNDEQLNHTVRFALEPTIHLMIKWDFAYRAARRGPWEEVARDRDRFCGRINCVSKILNPILQLQHRERIYQSRFLIRD